MKRTKLLVAIIVLLVCAALSVTNATVGLAAILSPPESAGGGYTAPQAPGGGYGPPNPPINIPATPVPLATSTPNEQQSNPSVDSAVTLM